MKRTLVIIAHPEVDDSNLQQFLLESSQSLESVTTYKLTDRKYNSKEEQQRIREFDRIIFQFPMYWYSAPYLLKKWLDEVFEYSFAKSELVGKELGLVVSLGTAVENFASGKPEKYTLSEIFRPFEVLANKCNMIYLPTFSISLFSYMGDQKKKRLLIDYQKYLTQEKGNTFKEEEEWFLERLNQISRKKTGKEKEILLQVLSMIIDAREELDELRLLIDEVRDEA